jgi:hypothetical protein
MRSEMSYRLTARMSLCGLGGAWGTRSRCSNSWSAEILPDISAPMLHHTRIKSVYRLLYDQDVDITIISIC